MSAMSRRSFLKTSSASMLAAGAAQPVLHSVMAQAKPGEALYAGVSTRDITPPPGLPMWGYSNPAQIAEGTRDPLMCRTLVLKVGDTALGWVVMDMGRMPVPGTVARIREKARAFGVDHVVFMATHTHSGTYMELPELPHLEPTENAIVDTLREALDRVEPVSLGIARPEIDIAHNRRLIRDGVCYMQWRNEKRLPTSPLDKEAGVVHIRTARGDKPLATLVNYACHPVIFGPDNRQYSADWAGEMARLVKEGGGGECFFLQGAAGDINPYLDKTPVDGGADVAIRSEGKRAADAVLAALANVRCETPGAPSIVYSERPVEVGTRWDLTDAGQVEILSRNYGLMYDKYMKGVQPDLAVPLGTLVLNGGLAFAFLPGEPFVDFQLDLKRRSNIANTFLCGYANEFHVYLPTVRDCAYGGYGAATVTYAGLGAGEKLVTQATVDIGRATGHYGPLAGPEDFRILEL